MSLRRLLATALALAAASLPAHAQVSRVFVSVNGNDGNTCSNVASPCRTLAGGIAQVDAQGEVIVIESGSYAGGTIAKSVKINVPAGIVAFSGLPIVVDPGGGGTVVLRGLTLKAATAGSGTGVTHQSGTLFVENTVVDGWGTGLNSVVGAARLFVKGSVFRNNGNGLVSQSGSVAAIDDSFFENNGNVGVWFVSGKGRVSNTAISGNLNLGGNLWATAEVTFERCKVSDNGYGLRAEGPGAVLRVSQSTVTRNYIGLSNSGSAVESFGNNVVRGNTFDTEGMITPVTLQ